LPCRAGDFAVTSTRDGESLDPSETVYPVFLGLPMGFNWVVHLCQNANLTITKKAPGADSF